MEANELRMEIEFDGAEHYKKELAAEVNEKRYQQGRADALREVVEYFIREVN